MYFDDKNCIKNVFLVIKQNKKKHKKTTKIYWTKKK